MFGPQESFPALHVELDSSEQPHPLLFWPRGCRQDKNAENNRTRAALGGVLLGELGLIHGFQLDGNFLESVTSGK